MLSFLLRSTLVVVLVWAAPRAYCSEEREAVAGVYLFEQGDLRFVLCLPKTGTAAFNTFRSESGKLTAGPASYSNPTVVNGTFSVGRHTFRVDEVRRSGWPPRKELTQIRYY